MTCERRNMDKEAKELQKTYLMADVERFILMRGRKTVCDPREWPPDAMMTALKNIADTVAALPVDDALFDDLAFAEQDHKESWDEIYHAFYDRWELRVPATEAGADFIQSLRQQVIRFNENHGKT